MDHRPLGRTGLELSVVGFGAFKIGRNQGIKYAHGYELPSEEAVRTLLHGVLDLGITYVDTAPAYGLSEARIGSALCRSKRSCVISTKVGETFESGTSCFDYGEAAVRQSVSRSMQRLRRDVLDLVYIHSNGEDKAVLEDTGAVATLRDLKSRGRVRAIGFSGKTPAGAAKSLTWADAIMVEYHLNDRSHEAVMIDAHSRGVGVVVKKGLASGTLPPAEAIRFVVSNPAVTSLVIGALDLEHLRSNVRAAAGDSG